LKTSIFKFASMGVGSGGQGDRGLSWIFIHGTKGVAEGAQGARPPQSNVASHY